MSKAEEEFVNKARIEGEKRGIQKGKKQGALESAIKMISDSLPIEKIAMYTGLPLSKVQELANGKLA